MLRLITWPLSLVALLVFTSWAKKYLPIILEPLFELTGGDPDILAWVFGLFVIFILLGAMKFLSRS